jgi:hypothetical protein
MRAPIASRRAAAASLASSRPDPPARDAAETNVAGRNPGPPVALAFALDGGVQTGVAPDPSWALTAGVDIALGRDADAAPSARLRGSFASSSTEATAYGDAQFRLIGAELTGCTQRFPAARVGVRPCALVQAGDLRGKGDNTIDRKVRHMLWLGFGAALRFEVSASSRFGLELEASGTRLLRSDRFVFEPELVVHTVPEWAFGVRAGPVMRFF